jgi:hypothetical protein
LQDHWLAVANAAGAVVVDCANARGVLDLPQLEVLRSVVVPNAVSVVDSLVWQQIAPKGSFHDKDVLKHVRETWLRPRVIFGTGPDIAMAPRDGPSALPIDRALSSQGPSVSVSALLGAKASPPVRAPKLFSASLAASDGTLVAGL